jgi:2-hydroxyglutarate dehydrogenase
MIRHDVDKGRKGLVELLGFNSPGLTSSLATGEYVARMVRREVWGMKVGRGDVERLADGWE